LKCRYDGDEIARGTGSEEDAFEGDVRNAGRQLDAATHAIKRKMSVLLERRELFIVVQADGRHRARC